MIQLQKRRGAVLKTGKSCSNTNVNLISLHNYATQCLFKFARIIFVGMVGSVCCVNY